MSLPFVTTWSFPTRILFGRGAVRHVGLELSRLGGKHALIVTDRGVVAAGLLAQVEVALREAGLAASVFSDVVGNPVEANVEDGARAFREAGADCVVSLGGGSPLDVGKLVALRVNHHRPLVDYDDATGGDRFIGPDVPPIVTIPTTAGTGSEVGRSGVVTLEQNHRKTVIFSPHLLAKVAILDPELSATMPAFVTAATGYDALTHLFEAFVAKGDHPLADGIAQEGLRLVAKHLERAVTHGHDLDARGGMLKAAMLGAVAFQKGLGACHSLAHPLSSEHGLHHGLANALCLPPVAEYVSGVAAERLAHASRLLGGEPTAAGCVAVLRSIRERIDLPSGLGDATRGNPGVPRASLGALADLAFVDACHQSSPRACTREDLLRLYEASY